MDRRAEQLLGVAAEAQALINEAIGTMTASEIDGSAFDQLGLRDGAMIVEEYLRAGDLDLAFEHLLYMVNETGIPVSLTSMQFLTETATALRLPRPRVR